VPAERREQRSKDWLIAAEKEGLGERNFYNACRDLEGRNLVVKDDETGMFTCTEKGKAAAENL
jgi:hypothetical protein